MKLSNSKYEPMSGDTVSSENLRPVQSLKQHWKCLKQHWKNGEAALLELIKLLHNRYEGKR